MKKFIAPFAVVVAAGAIYAGTATANVDGVCTTPGTVRADLVNFNPNQNHVTTVDVVVDGEPLGLNREVVVKGGATSTTFTGVPEGYVQVVVQTTGRGAEVFTSPVVKCATEPVQVTPDTSTTTPVNPDKPVKKTTKKTRVKITTKTVKFTVNKVSCFTPARVGRSYAEVVTRVTWFKNGKKFKVKTSAPKRVYGNVCAVNG